MAFNLTSYHNSMMAGLKGSSRLPAGLMIGCALLMLPATKASAQTECGTVKECAEEMVDVVVEMKAENQALLERIEKLENRTAVLQCRKHDEFGKIHNRHSISVTAEVPPAFKDYQVTGGSCSFSHFDPNQWSYLDRSQIAGDGRGWVCSSQHIPNFASNRQLLASVIFCKASIK